MFRKNKEVNEELKKKKKNTQYSKVIPLDNSEYYLVERNKMYGIIRDTTENLIVELDYDEYEFIGKGTGLVLFSDLDNGSNMLFKADTGTILKIPALHKLVGYYNDLIVLECKSFNGKENVTIVISDNPLKIIVPPTNLIEISQENREGYRAYFMYSIYGCASRRIVYYIKDDFSITTE